MTVLLIIVGIILFLVNPLIGLGFGLCFVSPILGGIVIGAGVVLGLASH